MFQELSFRGTFTPVELSFLGSERSQNFRSYETVIPWEPSIKLSFPENEYSKNFRSKIIFRILLYCQVEICLWTHCFPAFHNVCKGAKVPQEQKVKRTEVVCGANVPRVWKFHGAKVPGTFTPEERKFLGCESSMERKFLDFLLPGSKCSTERKFHESKSWTLDFSLPGTKVHRNEKSKYQTVKTMCQV